MTQTLAIIKKDILQWTRRPLYFISSVLLAVLIMSVVGNTISGATLMPFGLYDPASISDLAGTLSQTKRFRIFHYANLDTAKADLKTNKIVALASISQDPLQDTMEILTEGHNPMLDNQIAMGLLTALTNQDGDLGLPIHFNSIYPTKLSLRDYVTPGLAAYLCYVLAAMNVGFSWIYEWMEKTYRNIILAPDGLRSVIIAKTLTVTVEASIVLWLALAFTAPAFGFSLGSNYPGIILYTLLSTFTFTCLGLAAACLLKTIRIYTMTVSIFGVALMFVSGIIIPVEAMPDWEQCCARLFPMYYSADAFKGVMLGNPAHYSHDIAILLAWSGFGLLISTILLLRRKAQL
jgi:ABC-type multidrug transport system permease subunit